MTIQFTDFYDMSSVTTMNARLAFWKLYTCCLSSKLIIFDRQSSSHFLVDQQSLKIKQVPQHDVAIIYQQPIFDIQYHSM